MERKFEKIIIDEVLLQEVIKAFYYLSDFLYIVLLLSYMSRYECSYYVSSSSISVVYVSLISKSITNKNRKITEENISKLML